MQLNKSECLFIYRLLKEDYTRLLLEHYEEEEKNGNASQLYAEQSKDLEEIIKLKNKIVKEVEGGK